MTVPVTRFVVLADTHLRDPAHIDAFPQTWAYPLGVEKAHWALDWIRQPPDGIPVQFVIFGGDMIDGYMSKPMLDLEFLCSLTTEYLAMPIYPCLGNHENVDGEDAVTAKAYLERFGAPDCNYTFDEAGLRFIVIDTSDTLHDPEHAPIQRNNFVEAELDRAKAENQSVILISHVPLCPIRDEPALMASFEWKTHRVLEPILLALVEQYADNVLAVVSGHLHLSGMVIRAGVHHLVTAGTASYPADMAVFDVNTDQIDVSLIAPPNELLTTEGNMHGHERHGRDFTDHDHPDRASYLWGNPSERRFSIPF